MRKPELAAVIADKADLTKEKANQVLNAILDSITGALDKDTVLLALIFTGSPVCGFLPVRAPR